MADMVLEEHTKLINGILHIEAGYVLYTGAIASQSFADNYNTQTDMIERTINNEELKNGRHRMFTIYALMYKPNKCFECSKCKMCVKEFWK